MAKPVTDDRSCRFGAQIMLMPPSGVVGVPVSDKRSVDRAPGVNIDIGGRAVNPFVGEFE